MSVIIAFDARPEKGTGQGIIGWYTDYGYLSDFLEAVAVNAEGKITYNGSLYEITFMPNEYWPNTLQGQADEANIYLGNPDDGNYPIDGYVVESKIRFINGQAVEPR
jgi:hypothetical protein